MSLLGVAVATWLSHHSSGAENIESYAIGVALVIGGLGLVAKTFIKRGIQPDDAPFILDALATSSSRSRSARRAASSSA